MDEFLFINDTYIKNNSPVNDNVDFKLLRPTIIRVQDIYLQAKLGTPLYEELCAAGLAETLSADQQYLIEKYIQKTVLYYFLTETTPDFKFRYMNKGVMVKSSENSQQADTKDIIMLMDMWKNSAESYAELMTNYLKQNTTKFPKYIEYTTTGYNHDDQNYTTGLYLEDYDDYEQKNCKQNYGRTGCDETGNIC